MAATCGDCAIEYETWPIGGCPNCGSTEQPPSEAAAVPEPAPAAAGAGEPAEPPTRPARRSGTRHGRRHGSG